MEESLSSKYFRDWRAKNKAKYGLDSLQYELGKREPRMIDANTGKPLDEYLIEKEREQAQGLKLMTACVEHGNKLVRLWFTVRS